MHATFCCLSSAADLEAILAHINLKSGRGKHIAELPKSQQYSQAQITPPWVLHGREWRSQSQLPPPWKGVPQNVYLSKQVLWCNQKHRVDNCHCHLMTDVFRVPSSTVFKHVPPHRHRDVKACTKAAIWHFLQGLEFALSLYCDMISLVPRQLWFSHCWSLSSGTGIHL